MLSSKVNSHTNKQKLSKTGIISFLKENERLFFQLSINPPGQGLPLNAIAPEPRLPRKTVFKMFGYFCVLFVERHRMLSEMEVLCGVEDVKIQK